ncbi:MAG: hypothetical protein A2804_00180 [Candidatus Pacebacteria bacterium RIFCSPHIGHO2_01_FULL_46_10]|nr:MAG: hypothetical protein A2804_00180 [Candidatus Pacebacteria bacterium RIFCSPHIGHO2_01_FULL_46_10]
MGKAKNLKKRVSSYARPQVAGKTKLLVEEAVTLKHSILHSELEALLVEAELVRSYQPTYNILLKDDKTPLYIVITKETFPRVLTARKKSLLYTQQKGTIFGPFPSAYKVRQVLHIARRIFPWCNERIKTGKPCFYFHLGLCSGACAGKIKTEEYQQTIVHLKEFLRGKTSKLLSSMKVELKRASATQDFEKAALYRDQMRMIEEVTKNPHILGPNLDLPQLSSLESENMLAELRRVLSQYISLPKTYVLERIEGYDISNTQGLRPVASMVVFTHGRADTQEYKSFNIRLGETPNDYGMLQEALTRRQLHPEWGMPNVVLIDGGKGQLRAALSVWKWQTPVVSLAKDPDRLLIYNQETERYTEHPLRERDPASILLQRVRDEAHRFAKSRHARRRTKSVLE